MNTLISHKLSNNLLDLSLLVPAYWVIYALPHCFSSPFTRIPLPPPFFTSTGLAPSIVSLALIYITSSILTRGIPTFFRMCIPLLVMELGFVSYELPHSSIYRLFHPTYGHQLWRINLALMLFIELCLLYLFHIYLERRDIKLVNINRFTLIAALSYIILTLYQVQRGFYITILNDHITLLQQTALFWMYPALLWRKK